MKSELRLGRHAVIGGANVIEVWYQGQFIATVAGADGGGVRVISKHPIEVFTRGDDADPIGAVEIKILYQSTRPGSSGG